MILPHEHDSFVPQDNESTIEKDAGNPAPWLVSVKIEALIEVAPNDASNEKEAAEFAVSLIKDLPLKVSLGGVPLKARYI